MFIVKNVAETARYVYELYKWNLIIFYVTT